MLEGIYIASSGAARQLRKMDVLSSNLANLNTPGFKKDFLVYQEAVPPFSPNEAMQVQKNIEASLGKITREASYVSVADQKTQYTQGTLQNTGNPLDLALDGDGFFVIETEGGPRYTRKGNFRMNTLGQLTTNNGDPVLSKEGQPIAIPTTGGKITIDQQGTLSVGNGSNIFPAGQLKVVRFAQTRTLQKEGNGLFRQLDPQAKEESAKSAKVMQGFVESSNVNVVQEMVRMIEAVRTMEAYQKIIQSIDEADNQSVNNLSRVI